MKTKLKNILIVLFSFFLLFLFQPKINGQESIKHDVDQENKFKYAVGAGAGFTTGYGLSYRYFPSKYGAQVNFAPYHTKEIDRYSLGLTLLYMMIESKTTNLFLYQGNHYYYNSEIMYYTDLNQTTQTTQTTQPSPIQRTNRDSYVNNGIGIGIEFIVSKRIGFNLMAGYAAYKNFEQLNFTGESALYFKFGGNHDLFP